MSTWHITVGRYAPRTRQLGGGGYTPRTLTDTQDLVVSAPTPQAARKQALATVGDGWKVLHSEEVV